MSRSHDLIEPSDSFMRRGARRMEDGIPCRVLQPPPLACCGGGSARVLVRGNQVSWPPHDSSLEDDPRSAAFRVHRLRASSRTRGVVAQVCSSPAAARSPKDKPKTPVVPAQVAPQHSTLVSHPPRPPSVPGPLDLPRALQTPKPPIPNPELGFTNQQLRASHTEAS